MRNIYRAELLICMMIIPLSACVPTASAPDKKAAPPVIATAGGQNANKALEDGMAAVAYDPDGCQVWIIDNGTGGYASPRYDPKSGLPVCNDMYAPGSVIGEYRTKKGKGSNGDP